MLKRVITQGEGAFLEVMEPMAHNLILVTKKEEKLNFPKAPKMAICNINILKNVPERTHKPLFSSKIP